MAFNTIFILPLRVAQALFAVIVLGVLAYCKSSHISNPPFLFPQHPLSPSLHSTNALLAANAWRYAHWTPSQISFMIFCSIWTFLVLVYLVVAPIRFQRYSHKFAILGLEAVTMIFWFAGFIALADMLNWWSLGGTHWGPYRAAVAGCVLGAFEW
jgi:hypothetical protein